MTLTLNEAIDAIMRGETQEEYTKRIRKIRRLSDELYDLEDSLEVLGNNPLYESKILKKQKRLEKVRKMLDELK